MTAVTTPGQPGTARQERQPGLPDRMARYGIWLAVGVRMLGDRRLQAAAVTGALAAVAFASLTKNNQARPVRRVAAWYTKSGVTRELHRAEQALTPGKDQS